MTDLFFLIVLFGSFVYGTLAAGTTRSMGRMIVWGIFSLLPLTLFWVFSCLFCAPMEQAITRILTMFGGALFLHVAVSYCIRSFHAQRKEKNTEITEREVIETFKIQN